MNTENLKQWIENPSQMNRDSLLELKSILDEYPCFTTARILYLKNLLNSNDMHFSSSLIRTSISVPDRRRLYYFIEGKKLPEYKVKPSAGMLETGGFSLIDRYLNTEPVSEETPSVIEPSLFDAASKTVEKPLEAAPAPTISSVQSKILNENEIKAPSKVIGEGLLLDYTKYLSAQPEMEQEAAPMEGQDLIDKFLTSTRYKEPLIKPNAAENRSSFERSELKVEEAPSILEMPEFSLPEDSFTETLARIYLKQKRYDRAIEIFKSLSLKYPEKNSYFADQIRFLEKLIVNLKK